MLKHNTGAAQWQSGRSEDRRVRGSLPLAATFASPSPNSEQQLERELKIARPTGAEDGVKSGASPRSTSQ